MSNYSSKYKEDFFKDKEENGLYKGVLSNMEQWENRYGKEFFQFTEEEMKSSLDQIYKDKRESTIKSYSSTYKKYISWIEKTSDYKLSFNYKNLMKEVRDNSIEESNITFLNRSNLYEDLNWYSDLRVPIILKMIFEGIGGDRYNKEIMNLKISDIEGNKVKLITGRTVTLPNDLVEFIQKYYNNLDFSKDEYLIQGTAKGGNINREKSQVLRNMLIKLYNIKEYKKYELLNIKGSGKCFYLGLLEKKNGKLSIEDYYKVIKKYSSGNPSYSNASKLRELYKKYKDDKSISFDYNVKNFEDILYEIENTEVDKTFIEQSQLDDDKKLDELLIKEFEDIMKELSHLIEKYRNDYTKFRIGQGKFRDKLIKKHGCKCAICEIKNKELLIASHIKEFCNCENNEHIDAYNGLLLCANHDKLFDKHIITFDNDGKIIISDKINKNDYLYLNINENIKIDKNMFKEKYMNYHRSKLQK